MEKKLIIRFYCSEHGREPVREWLTQLNKKDRQIIGNDLKTIQYGWPLGMPLVRKLNADLWEVRSNITDKRISRLIFYTEGNEIVLLNGFIKKSQKTAKHEIVLALSRKTTLK